MRFHIFIVITFFLFSCQESTENKQKAEEPVLEQEQGLVLQDSVQEKLESINLSIRQNVNNANLYLQRAELYSNIGDYQSAAADVERAQSIDSTSAEVYLTSAKIYSKIGELTKVKESLEKGLRINPENSELHTELGELYLYVKNNKKSMEHADKAIRYDIYNADAYYLKGFNFLEMGDTVRAISSFQTTVEQDPNYIDAYLQLGLIYSMKNDPIALDYIQNVLEIDSNHKEALYTYAMYAQSHEMYNEAIQTYTKLTKAHPDFREAYYNLGYIHMYYLQLYRQATFHFSDAIDADPNYFQAYYNRGYCYELMGDIRNAAIDYRKALEVKPDYDLAAKGLTRVEELANMDI